MGGALEQGDRRISHAATLTSATRRRVGLPVAWQAVPAVLFLAGFFILPLLNNTSRSFDVHSGLANYAKLLSDPYYLNVTGVTVGLSTVVTAICLILGYPTAYFLVRLAGRWSGVIVFLLIAPLLTSIIMRSFGWQVILARGGLLNALLLYAGWIDRPLRLLNGPVAGIIGLAHVQMPFMVLSIAAVLQGINPRLEEAAQILGAGRWTAFRRITLPLSLDGIGTGCILVFMLTNGSFVTLLLLGGGSLQTLPLLIYQQFNTTRDVGMGAAMSNVLLVIAVACLYLQLRLLRRRGVKTT